MVSRIPEIGEKIGDYELVREIGRGGFGVVFEALDTRLNRQAALKFLAVGDDEEAQVVAQRFRREIDLIRRLNHPNVVQLFDFDVGGKDTIWMAMEYVDGRGLDEVLQEQGKLEPARVRHIMLQVVSALVAAHQKSVLHRDLKPANIMLARKGADHDVVKLLDFGIGKAIGEGEDPALQDLTGSIRDLMLTPRYTAPELLMMEGKIGPGVDLYSAGLILYEVLVGKPAFEAESRVQLLAKQIGAQIQIPDWLKETPFAPIISHAVEKKPKDRFQSAMGFHQALLDIDLEGENGLALDHLASMDQLATEVVVDDTVEAFFEPRSRKRLGALVVLLLFAVILAGVAVWWLLGSFSERSKEKRDVPQAEAPKEDALSWPGEEGQEEDISEPEVVVAAPEDVVEEPEVVAPPVERKARVSWSVESEPSGASVSKGDEVLCAKTPCELRFEQSEDPIQLTFKLRKHHRTKEKLVPKKDGSLKIELKPKKRREGFTVRTFD